MSKTITYKDIMLEVSQKLYLLENSNSEYAPGLINMLNTFVLEMNDGIDGSCTEEQLKLRKDYVTEALSYIDTLVILDII